MILAAAFLSYKTTTKEVREANHFTWDAIQEVATLFIGIFVTMIPALLILKARGASLGVNEPWQYFWMTGLLSSFWTTRQPIWCSLQRQRRRDLPEQA